jgi:hypothetical protein
MSLVREPHWAIVPRRRSNHCSPHDKDDAIGNLFHTSASINVRSIFAGIAQLVEQLICNSSLTNCAAFHCFAYRCCREVIRNFAFAVRSAELHSFAAKFCPTVE